MKHIDSNTNVFEKLLVLKGIVPEDSVLCIDESNSYAEIIIHDDMDQNFMENLEKSTDHRNIRNRNKLISSALMLLGMDWDGDTVTVRNWIAAVDAVIYNNRLRIRIRRWFNKIFRCHKGG